MKPPTALGLVLAIVGALVALAAPALRPVGGALAICGLALVIYSLLPRGARRDTRGPYSWEDDEKGGPQEIYTANPGEVQLKSRQSGQVPDFAGARPGDIPMPRQPASGRPAQYTAAENSDVPAPRHRERTAAEYAPTPREMRAGERTPPGPGPRFVPDLLNGEDPGMPPMAPPPPRPDRRP